MPTPNTGYAIASVAALTAIGAADRAEGYARLLLDDGSGNQTWVVYDDSATSGDYQPDDTPATGYWIKAPKRTATGQSLFTAADEAAARDAIGLPTAGLQLQPTQRAESSTQITHTAAWATVASVSITPTRADSVIEIFAQVPILFEVSPATLNYGGIRLVQGASVIFDSNPTDATGPFGLSSAATQSYQSPTIAALHEPGVTTSLTYSAQVRIYAATSGRSLKSCPAAAVQNATAFIEVREVAS